MNATKYGSRSERERWWGVVFDIPPQLLESLGVESMFRRLTVSMQVVESLPAEHFLFELEELRELCHDQPYGIDRPPFKKKMLNADWKMVHEELFSAFGLIWPPDVSSVGEGFREREKELVLFFWGQNLSMR